MPYIDEQDSTISLARSGDSSVTRIVAADSSISLARFGDSFVNRIVAADSSITPAVDIVSALVSSSFEAPPLQLFSDDMLLEPEDFGAIYDNQTTSVMGDNKVVLHTMIEGIKTGSLQGAGIQISGPSVVISGGISRRVAGTLHVNVDPASTAGGLATNAAARGPVTFPVDGSGNVIPFILAGAFPGSVLQGRGTQETVGIFGPTVVIDNTTGQAANDPDNVNMQFIYQLNIRSNSRCVWIKRGGRNCILQRVHLRTTGLLSDTAGSTNVNWTEWHTWDEFQTRLDLDNVPYAIRIDNSDGVKLLEFSVKDSLTHAILITRLHDGDIDARCSENKGVGLAADAIRGCRISLRAESNGSYAALLNQASENEIVRIWPENNRRWANNVTNSYTGNKHRMIALGAGCQANTLKSHATNRHNLWRMSEGIRLSNTFRDLEWIDPSRAAVAQASDLAVGDLDTSIVDSGRNYGTVWTNATFRPSIVLNGNDIELTIPSGAYDTANIASSSITSFLFPFASFVFPAVAAGDIIAWSCDVEFDAAAVAFCVAAETNRDANLTLAMPLFIKMLHADDPGANKELEQAHANIHMWNSGSLSARTRTFAGRKRIYPGVDTAFPDMSIGTWTPGLDDAGPSGDILITIRNLSIYHLPEEIT